MSIASTLIKAATTILNLGGSEGTLKKTIVGPYNPVTGEVEKIVQTYPIQVSNPSHIERWENGSLVRQGEDSMIIGTKGLTVAPETGDLVTIGQVDWTISAIREVQAQNETVVYKATVTR